jgi:hypothetical protein
MRESEAYEGGCLCGAIRYRVTGKQLRGTICHCSICKKWSGSPFLSWALFNKGQFGWIRGAPGTIKATPAVARKFCERCGSPLTFEFTDSSEIMGVTTGTLDEPDEFRPTRHNWTSKEVSWLDMAAKLPRNLGDAGDEKVST